MLDDQKVFGERGDLFYISRGLNIYQVVQLNGDWRLLSFPEGAAPRIIECPLFLVYTGPITTHA